MTEVAENTSEEADDTGLETIAKDALDCIETVADGAETALHGSRGGKPDSFASVNTWTGGAQVGNLKAISESERTALRELIGQPVIARVEFVDDDGKPETVFITRTTPPSGTGYNIASYRSPLGSIASRAVGEDLSVRLGGAEREVEIVNTARLKPAKTEEGWDSRDSEIDLGPSGKYTVVSLRELLTPTGEPVAEDAWDAWEREDQETNVLDGIRRAVLSHMGLRDQPILDQHQDEIFRLPLDTRCFLSGPPGTGKTTTLIRRLGQKIDLDDEEALMPAERAMVDRASSETGTNHRISWAMFSPTELLRQYVKEAFAREGFAASDHHIHTWDQFRDSIARDHFRLLRTSTGSGAFYKREQHAHLDVPLVTNESATWYDDFDTFFTDDLFADLTADAEWVSNHKDEALAKLGGQLANTLNTAGPKRFIGALPSTLPALMGDIRKHLEDGRTETNKIITKTLNRLVHEDSGFPASLKQEIERQLALAEQEDRDDPDAEFDALDEEESVVAPGRSVSKEEVRRRYTQAVSALARARANRRKVSEKGRNGQLLSWLGEERIPAEDDLKTLGRIVATQRRLRRFASFETLLFRSVSPKYRKFRQQRNSEGRWYVGVPSRSADICWQELDLLVLFMLRTAGKVLSEYRRMPGRDIPEGGILGAVAALYKNQILVDEATDFSVLQLASMFELSHPLVRSFFICGDLNQRLTGWGIKSYDEIDWIASDIERHKITVSYRQSERLVNLAKSVATLGGSQPDEIVLPDRLDIEGVAPVWKTRLSSDADRAEWLSDRIRDIENMVGKVPTIAVLVNDEQEVEPLALALEERLKEINLPVEACKDGKVVGKDNAVRVFNIEHIKGLEFEAVFFTNLDQTIENHPDLFTQYLYVGSTRAATYLGVSFKHERPAMLASLSEHFVSSWETQTAGSVSA